MSKLSLMSLAIGFSLISAAPLSAQVGGVGQGYLSPWLNLYTKQGGPVDNYHMYVEPALQLQSTLQNQQMGIQQNAAGIASNTSQFTSQNASYYTPASPTGVAAGFMNQGGYFNTNRSQGFGSGVTGNRPGFGGTAAGGIGGIGGGIGGIGGGGGMGGMGVGMGGMGAGMGTM
jgi:hypothetical protein